MKKILALIGLCIISITGCTLSSRESVNLNYQQQQIMNTLDGGPLKTIMPDGSFIDSTYVSWDFSKENMILRYSNVVDFQVIDSYQYSVEIIEDISVAEGVIRLFGNGPLDGKFIGIYALTNSAGAFVKISIQDQQDQAVENAKAKKYWEYATNPIIFRLHELYMDKKFVSLTDEEFFESANYEYFIPIIRAAADGSSQYILKTGKVIDGVASTEKEVVLSITRVIPLLYEIYEISPSKFIGVEFSPTKGSSKIKMVQANSLEQIGLLLEKQSYYNFQFEEDADKPNRVIKATQGKDLVKLRKSAGAAPGTGLYYWEGTEELLFDPKKMTLRVIDTFSPLDPTVPLGVTNIYNYTIKMVDDSSATSGIFAITGAGGYHGSYGALVVHPKENGEIFADFATDVRIDRIRTKLDTFVNSPTLNYQDINSAIRPYRLIENLDSIGPEWVQLSESKLGGMEFDNQNTEIYSFLNLLDRTLKYTSIKQGIPSESFYKVKVAFDISDIKGFVQLIGYDGPEFKTIDETKELHGLYLGIHRGSELYKTQAKYVKNYNLETAKAELENVPLFNLHERASVPSDYRVITQMEKYGPWVALIYNGLEPGTITDAIPNNAAPSYSANNTDKWEFDTTLLPEVKITRTRDGVIDPPTLYRIKPIQDISETYGIFMFELYSGADIGYDSSYFAIKTGTGSSGDKGYIGIGGTQEQAIANLEKINSPTRLLNNYNAENTAPVAPTVIQYINGIRYIEFVTNKAGLPTGVVTPYDTKVLTFDLNTLTLSVETFIPTQKNPSVETYAIRMRLDEGNFAGVFQLQGEGLAWNRQYMRLDVQQGDKEKQKIRVLLNNNLDNLANGTVTPIENVNEFTVFETTHGDELRNQIATTHLKSMFPLSFVNIENVGIGKVDPVDFMFDFKNTTYVKINFSVDPHTIRIIDIVDGVEVENSQYTILAMSDVLKGSQITSIVKLVGAGSQRNLYMAFKKMSHSSQFVYIIFAESYAEAVSKIAAAEDKDKYIVPTYPWSEEINTVYNYFGSIAGKGYGTPSFVWMKNSSYNPMDTETITFNTEETNLRIIHNTGEIIDYNVYMENVINKAEDADKITIDKVVIYLRSKDARAPYNRKYLVITNVEFVGKPAPGKESTFKLSLGDTVADADAAAKMEFRDLASATIPASAINIASARTWIRVAPDKPAANDQFQLNKDEFEIWKFKVGGANIISVENQDGTLETYTFTSREDTSSHRGVFILASTTGSGKYHNSVLAIGIGGEAPLPAGQTPPYNFGTDYDSVSMRLGVALFNSSVSIQEADRQAVQNRNSLAGWNIRDIEKARFHFNPIMKAAEFDDANVGWAKLQQNSLGNYVYDSANTERWKFVPSTPSRQNVNGSIVYDVLIKTSAEEPTDADRYGIQLISSSSTGYEATYKIFRKNDSSKPIAEQRSNKFVVLSLGLSLNQKSMRIGMGNTLAEAQDDFNAKGLDYNWSTYDKATVNSTTGVATKMQQRGNWTLTRNGTMNATGSGTTTSGTGHFNVQLNGTGKPSYEPNNTIDITFSMENEIISIKNIESADDLLDPPQTYGIIRVENGAGARSEEEGIYILSGFGPYNNTFVYLDLAEAYSSSDTNTASRARLSIAATLDQVKTMNKTLKDNNTFNFFLTQWLKVSDRVVLELFSQQKAGLTLEEGQYGAYVYVGYEEDPLYPIYDHLLTKSITVLPNVPEYESQSIIISNRSTALTRDDRYIYEMVEEKFVDTTKDSLAIMVLKGTGPDGGKFLGIRKKGTQGEVLYKTFAAMYFSSSITELKRLLRWDTENVNPTLGGIEDFYVYRNIHAVNSLSTVIQTLQNLGSSMVLLDADGVYLDDNTTEWSFDAPSSQITIIQRTPDGSSQVHIYRAAFFKLDSDSSSTGIAFLKSTTVGGSFNKYLFAIKVVGNQARLYGFNTADGFSTALNSAQSALTGNDTTYPKNFVLKSEIYHPRTKFVFDAAASIGSGSTRAKWGSLNADFSIGTENQITNVTIIPEGQNLTIQIGSSTYQARYRPSIDEYVEGQPNTKVVFQIMEKKGSTPTLPDEYKNAFAAVELDQFEIPTALRMVRIPGTYDKLKPTDSEYNSLKTARAALADNNFITSETLTLNRRSFNNMNSISPHHWRQYKADGITAAGAPSSSISDWVALYNRDRDSAPWTYDLNPLPASGPDGRNYGFGMTRASETTLTLETPGTTIQSRARLVKDGGDYFGVFKLYQKGYSNNAPQPTYQVEQYNDDFFPAYHAFEVGIGPNYYKAKIMRAPTLEEAERKRNALSFWNFLAYESWNDSKSRAMFTNLNRNPDNSSTVEPSGSQFWVKWKPGDTFDRNNYEAFSFTYDPAELTMTQHILSSGNRLTYVYGVFVTVIHGSTQSVLSLTGFGPLSSKLISIQKDTSSIDAYMYFPPDSVSDADMFRDVDRAVENTSKRINFRNSSKVPGY